MALFENPVSTTSCIRILSAIKVEANQTLTIIFDLNTPIDDT